MSISWSKRKTRLIKLLESGEDEDTVSLALDRILHGQSVIGKTCKYSMAYSCAFGISQNMTAKTTKIDKLRFTDDDLDIIGTLEYGQFAVVSVFACYSMERDNRRVL